MNKHDAERIARRALRDGFYSAEIERWPIRNYETEQRGWKVVLLSKDALVGGKTVWEYDEYEQVAFA